MFRFVRISGFTEDGLKSLTFLYTGHEIHSMDAVRQAINDFVQDKARLANIAQSRDESPDSLWVDWGLVREMIPDEHWIKYGLVAIAVDAYDVDWSERLNVS